MTLNYYGSVELGNAYFQEQLDCSDWFDATDSKKLIALKEATQVVDNLQLLGDKKTTTQELQFPRDYQDSIPDRLYWAVYEIAKRLLAGFDIEKTTSSILKREKFGPVEREYYEFREENAYLFLGIPSMKAYRYLLPFIRQPSSERVRV